VADALIRLKAPKLKRKIKYDPEAGMFVAYGTDRDALAQLARLLREAIEKANPPSLPTSLRPALTACVHRRASVVTNASDFLSPRRGEGWGRLR
jgi:hypothetical protein